MSRKRPWDKTRKIHNDRLQTNDSTAATTINTTSCEYIVVDGVKFYADRFYLNDSNDGLLPHKHLQCECGALQPPPLLSRSKLVASLDLKAAILGTFALSLESMRKEFPSLFTGDVPCMILHGKKGWKPPDTIVTSVGSNDDSDVDSILGEYTETDPEMLEASIRIPGSMHFAEIKSTWLPQQPSTTMGEGLCCPNTGALRTSIIEKRLAKRGVHHPKYMLLFEKCGSIVVLVSTANLTAPGVSTDGTWVQRFRPSQSSINSRTATTSDFGTALFNLLQHSAIATAAEQMTVLAFCQRYLQWKSLFDIVLNYDYRPAVVSLVVTVPGEYTTDAYGMQRMQHLVETMPWSLKNRTKDRLILQPTSFGSDWHDKNLVDLARTYLETKSEKAVLQRLEVFWPTCYFVERASTHQVTLDQELTFSPKQQDSRSPSISGEGGFLFLSSESFNKIGVDCLARMSMYEPTCQQGKVMVPHFKSIARIYEGCDYPIRKTYGLPKCEEYFSWFLLTSACLSRGAQGERQEDDQKSYLSYTNFELGVLFSTRMGGTRCSSNRLYCFQPLRCICGKPPSTKPASEATAALVHLPCPYSFHPPSYTDECSEEISFRETPFFHEIMDGTGAMGNMKFTPLGKSLARDF